MIPGAAITQYFVRDFNVANPAQYGDLQLRLLRDDGAVVYVNGIEVARSNMPAGAVNASTLASSTSCRMRTRRRSSNTTSRRAC